MSYSTLTHRAGGRAFLQFRTSPLKPWLGWIVSIILAGFAATFSGISRLHLVDFSVVFSFKFDFYSEIKCVQSRAVILKPLMASSEPENAINHTNTE